MLTNTFKTISQFKYSLTIFLVCLSIFFYSTESFSQSTHYYDGDQKIVIQEEKGMLAEPGLQIGTFDSSIVKRADSNASIVKNQGSMRVWKTDSDSTKKSVSRSIGSKVASRLLPVYRSPTGSILIPTGNMIVYFSMGILDSQVKSWAASKGLRAIQKMPFSTKNAWEIETPPGTQSIEIANSVRGESIVEAAIPNFWMEFSQK